MLLLVTKEIITMEINDVVEGSQSSLLSRQKSALAAHKLMLDNQVICDVTFEFTKNDETKSIGAHKYMLGSRSSVFFGMFNSNDNTDVTDVIQITDNSFEEFKEMLQFIYSEELNLSDEVAVGVMYASKKYMLKELSLVCLEFFQKKIDVDHACSLLEQALKFREEAFAHMCMSFIKRNTKAVLDSDDFLKIDNGTLEKIVEHQSLGISELELFEQVLKWAKNKCQTKGLEETPNNLRTTIGEALFYIRFPNMKLDEFSTKVAQLGILLNEEIIQIFTLLTNSKTPLSRPFFPVKPRDTSGISILEVFSEFQMKNDFVQSTNFAMSFNASISTPIQLKSLIFFLGLSTQCNLTGTIQIIQGTVLNNTTLNCARNSPNYPSEAHNFPLGVCQLANVKIDKGYFQIIITYTSSDANFMLIGKEKKKKFTCEGVTFDYYITGGPLYAIEFNA